jgi:hypothetical protein
MHRYTRRPSNEPSVKIVTWEVVFTTPPEAQFGSHVSTSLVPEPFAIGLPQLVHLIGPMIHDASPDIWMSLGRTFNVELGGSKLPANDVKYTAARLSCAAGAPTLLPPPGTIPAAGVAAR